MNMILPLAGGIGLGACGSAGFLTAEKSGVALAASGDAGAAVAGLERPASACTVRVVKSNTSATSATAETPATIPIHSGAFRLKLRVFLGITIRLFY